jgi:hypothetical protein
MLYCKVLTGEGARKEDRKVQEARGELTANFNREGSLRQEGKG